MGMCRLKQKRRDLDFGTASIGSYFQFTRLLIIINMVKTAICVAACLASASAFVPGSAPAFSTKLAAKQDFLEAEPFYDQSTVPVNVWKNKAPFTGKVVSTKRIVGPQATGETCHIIIDHNGDFPYWEGQSWGVIPPGTREKDGKPHSVRLYSIASSRHGDDMTGKTGSLCVRRANYWSLSYKQTTQLRRVSALTSFVTPNLEM